MHHCLAACPCSLLQALATQEANRAAQNRLPPLWAIVAMVVLGFNEFMAVSAGMCGTAAADCVPLAGGGQAWLEQARAASRDSMPTPAC